MKTLNHLLLLSLFFVIMLTSLPLHSQQNGLHFDGVQDRVVIPYQPQLNFGNEFTIELWVKPDFVAGGLWRPLIARDHWNANDGFIFHISNGFVFFVNVQGPSLLSPISPNVWTHLAVSYDNGSYKLYKNGILATSAAGNYTNSVSAMYMGTRNNNDGNGPHPGDYFTGALDEVRLWDVALDQDDIQSKMNCRLSGNEFDLKLYYNLNQGVAGGANPGITTATDLGPDGFDGTLQNFSLNGPVSNWVDGIPNTDPCAPPIPTMSQWSLFLFLLGVVCLSMVLLYNLAGVNKSRIH